MITIGGTVLLPNLTPVVSAPVEVELVMADGFVVVGKYSLAPAQTVQTGLAGTWQMSVVPNDEITPSGTLYRITEKGPKFVKSYLIQVLASLGVGVHQVLDLMVPEPSPVGVTNNFVTLDYLNSIAVGGSGGPAGSPGGAGAAGYIGVASRAALDALTPVSALLVYQTDRSIYWVWNGSQYIPVGYPVFTSDAQRDANFTQPLLGHGYYSDDNILFVYDGASRYVPINGPVFTNGTERDAAYSEPGVGDWYYQDSNNAAEGPYYRNIAGQYRLPWNMPWGEIAYAQVTSSQGSITSIVDLTGLSVSPTLVANRKIRVTVHCANVQSTTTTDRVDVSIADGSNTQLHNSNWPVNTPHTVNCVFRTTTTAGSPTWKARAVRVGSGTATMGAASAAPSFIMVEDIGPSGAPA